MSTSSTNDNLPRVLIVKRPYAMTVFGDRFVASSKFEILKAFESPLPLPEFLVSHSHSVSAIIAPVAAPVAADLIRLLPHLRLVITTSTGVDHVDLITCVINLKLILHNYLGYLCDQARFQVGEKTNRNCRTRKHWLEGRKEAFGCQISYNSRIQKPYVSYHYYMDIHTRDGS